MSQLEGFLEDLLYDSRADPDTLKIFCDWATDEWGEEDPRVRWLRKCLVNHYSTGGLFLCRGGITQLGTSPWWAVDWLLSQPQTTLKQVVVEEGYRGWKVPSGLEWGLEWEQWLSRAMVHVDPERVYGSRNEATYAVKKSVNRWLQDLVKQCMVC